MRLELFRTGSLEAKHRGCLEGLSEYTLSFLHLNIQILGEIHSFANDRQQISPEFSISDHEQSLDLLTQQFEAY